MTKVAILQSNYIPWKGYFDLIAAVDVFVWYDEVQYTKQDWRNRNRIKTENGIKWISVPVTIKNLYEQSVFDTLIADSKFGPSHWSKLENAYRKAPYFLEISEWLKPIYLDQKYTHLVDINKKLITAICDYLKIDTEFKCSSEFNLVGDKTGKLVDLCKSIGATCYVSGPAAKSYLDKKLFADDGIEVSWFDYADYPEYPQLYGQFEHSVTVLDLLFNTGPESAKYMKLVK